MFKKKIAAMRMDTSEHGSPIWYDDQLSFMPDNMDSPKPQYPHSNTITNYNHRYPNNYPNCKKELDNLHYQIPPHQQFLQLPLLQTNTKHLAAAPPGISCSSMPIFGINVNQEHMHPTFGNNINRGCTNDQVEDQVTDWRVLDKFVASQLSQEDENNYSNARGNDSNSRVKVSDKQEMAPENTSTASSSSQIDLWK